MSQEEQCTHAKTTSSYCLLCSAVAFQKKIASKHPKYSYNSEISPIEIFKAMSHNNPRIPKVTNKFYTEKRRELLNIIRSINTKLDFNSQTFFLCIYYMDIIFSEEGAVYQSLYDYLLISLSCLVIASKFNENDPRVPDITKYISMCSDVTKYRYIFCLEEIRQGEVLALKKLGYKLNYYSIYHFIVFFFAHGVAFGDAKRKQLEKVYIHSRELLDYIIEDENDYETCIGDKNCLLAAIILKKVTENILGYTNNLFTEVYGINTNTEECMSLLNIVNRVYEKKVMKRKPKSITTASTAIKEPKASSTLAEKIQQSKTLITTYIPSRGRIDLNTSYSVLNGQSGPSSVMNNDINLRKRACSSNKDSHPTMNSNSITNNVSMGVSPAKTAANTISISSGTINSNNRNTTSHRNILELENSNGVHSKINNTINNEMLYQRYMQRKQYPYKQSSIRVKNESMIKKIYPDDILDKTKKIFDQNRKPDGEMSSFGTENFRNSSYLAHSNSNSMNQPSTIIINNNININTYIDRKNLNYVYDDYENGRKYGNITNTNSNSSEIRYGHFGTYYDYGYNTNSSNNYYKGVRSISGLNISKYNFSKY